MKNVYRCVKTITINNVLIKKTRNHITNTMILRRELKLLVTSSTHLLEDLILNQIVTIKGGIFSKSKDHIEISYQVGKRFDQRYKYVTDFTNKITRFII